MGAMRTPPQDKAAPDVVNNHKALFQASYVWAGITVVMLVVWALRGFAWSEWNFVAAPLSAALALAAVAFWVRAKPRNRILAITVGIIMWLILLGAVLAIAVPFL